MEHVALLFTIGSAFIRMVTVGSFVRAQRSERSDCSELPDNRFFPRPRSL
jgi:hypothetical protein